MNNNDKKSLPIGVFDSGVGGLTVLRALQKALPNESFLYLGDTARLPYGTKSPSMITRYTQQASEILHQRGIKMLVLACNTASSHAIPALQQTYQDLPILGVVEPGAKAACLASRSGHIAIIATEATVKAGGYQLAIKQIRPEAQVVARGCSIFVALAEEGWIDDPIAETVARRYLEPLFTAQNVVRPDCLVLACTHFPILLQSIKKAVSNEVTIIDSADSTALAVKASLERLQLENTANHTVTTHFLVTDAPERFALITGHFLGQSLAPDAIELVDLSQFI